MFINNNQNLIFKKDLIKKIKINRNFDFITRADFPAYLNRFGLNGKGAEVGVQHGEFS